MFNIRDLFSHAEEYVLSTGNVLHGDFHRAIGRFLEFVHVKAKDVQTIAVVDLGTVEKTASETLAAADAKIVEATPAAAADSAVTTTGA
jgi:hypothetical protein